MRKGRGEIKKVGDLFDTYRRSLVAPERSVVKTFIEVLEDVTGLTVDSSHVSYHPPSRTLTLSVRSALKSEILLHKDELLAHMKGRLGIQGAPKHIR